MVPLCDDREHALVRFLRGATRPVSAQEIGAELRIDVRKARGMVAHLRGDHHVPIASTPADGFWYPRSRADVERTVAQIRSRVIELERTATGLEIGAAETFGEQGTGQMALGL